MIEFVEYSREFFDKSKDWLSDPEMKRLTMTPSINEDERSKWFLNLREKDNYYIRGIKYNRKPIGAVGIKNINYKEGRGEYWGYIGEKRYIGKGIGFYMIEAMIKQARALNLKIISLKVADYNLRAISLYSKCGFHEVKRELKTDYVIIYMEKDLEDNNA